MVITMYTSRIPFFCLKISLIARRFHTIPTQSMQAMTMETGLWGCAIGELPDVTK